MNDLEKQRLRNLLIIEVEQYQNKHEDGVITDTLWLDEDSGQFYFTEAEMLVFRLEDTYCIPLIVAYFAYTDLVQLCHPSNYSGELLSLIEKAREDWPPAVYFNSEEPFETGADCSQWFAWLAKEFFDIPNRHSFAYHTKRTYNDYNVLVYSDEK